MNTVHCTVYEMYSTRCHDLLFRCSLVGLVEIATTSYIEMLGAKTSGVGAGMECMRERERIVRVEYR